MEEEERDVVDGGGESLGVARGSKILEDVVEEGEVVGEERGRLRDAREELRRKRAEAVELPGYQNARYSA